jgi:branched-chain amino acid transport system ATP-binding protein
MLALARAYISHPNLVLVDEASMGLAPLVVDMVFEFLANVAKEGTALLIVEQYIGRVLAIAERAYVLTNGAISYAGPATALLDEDVFDQYFGLGEESAVVGQQ